MSSDKVLRVDVSLKGRAVKTYRFAKDEISVGRNPDCDIFLDNLGISRAHLHFRRKPDGRFEVVDDGSANGTFLNDQPTRRAAVQTDDVVRVGKFSLSIGYEDDLREQGTAPRSSRTVSMFEGTTVLSRAELDGVLARARRDEPETAPEIEPSAPPYVVPLPVAPPPSEPAPAKRPWLVWAIAAAFVLGTGLSAVVLWHILR
jgi:predicted component of type VI protein secretion system